MCFLTGARDVIPYGNPAGGDVVYLLIWIFLTITSEGDFYGVGLFCR